MVSLNLFQYQDEVKRALIARKNDLDLEWDPMVASWLAYAFACETRARSLLLEDLAQRLEVWTRGEDVWQSPRNIGPLFFLVWLCRKQSIQVDETYIQKAVRMFNLLRQNADDRFSPFRSPEQVFLVTLGISVLERDEPREQFVQILASTGERHAGAAACVHRGAQRAGRNPSVSFIGASRCHRCPCSIVVGRKIR